ncbi:MAG: hypothetical protein AAGI14_11755 [Pseudomonadota bacterium]
MSILVVTSCTTVRDPALISISSYDGRVPISSFDKHNPYAEHKSGVIDAYVDFRRDGILSATLGCTIASSPFGFTADKHLRLSGALSIVEISKPVRECSDETRITEHRLQEFLSAEPAAIGWVDNALILEKGQTRLRLQSIQDVLGDATYTVGGE